MQQGTTVLWPRGDGVVLVEAEAINSALADVRTALAELE